MHTLLFPSFNSRFCSSKSSTLLSCCAVSRLGKRPTALSIDSSTGVTHASRGNSASKFQGLKFCLSKTPYKQHPQRSTKVTSSWILHPTRDFLQMHLQEPEILFFCSRVTHFGRDPSHHIETPTWISTRRSTSKGGTENGLLIAFLEESRMSTSSVSTGRLRSDSSSEAEASGSQKNKLTTRKGTWSNQPQLTHVTPIALLCSWVLQPIEVWRSSGLTSRSMPYGKGPLRSLLRRIS